MTKTVKNMLDEAFEKVPMVEPAEAIKWIDDPEAVFVDVRDKNSVINSGCFTCRVCPPVDNLY
ncbi:MAG: hypothetical protein P8L36_06720 [SAR324 cluster bacterium]|nr:hypothetical protein [SAR324 cluster bacterium]